jgi:ABC-type transport system involved in multi-copper enzyme maturation permease subunit
MIRFTWLQLRLRAAAAIAALAAFALVLAVTGPHLASLYASSAITGCHVGTCANAAYDFLSRLAVTSPYPIVYKLGAGLILAAPGIIGVFYGAPLIAREIESRTFALAWTQSVTRARWLAVKLAMTGLAAMAVTAALSLSYTWWAAPIGKAISFGGNNPTFTGGRLSPLTFATSGIAPLGYAAFAFALGTAAGALIRRTVPAMAVTLAIFAAAQIAVPLAVRPHLIPPDHKITTIQAAALNFGNLTATTLPGQPGAWIISSAALNAAGHPTSTLPAACAGATGLKAQSPGPCMTGLGYKETITYQPASRYWPLQELETASYLALALVMTGICFWRLRRRPC